MDAISHAGPEVEGVEVANLSARAFLLHLGGLVKKAVEHLQDFLRRDVANLDFRLRRLGDELGVLHRFCESFAQHLDAVRRRSRRRGYRASDGERRGDVLALEGSKLKELDVIALTAHERGPAAAAKIALPIAAWAELAGTTTNVQGRVQRMHAAMVPPGTGV